MTVSIFHRTSDVDSVISDQLRTRRGRSLAQPSQHRMLFWFAEDPSSVDCLKRLFKV